MSPLRQICFFLSTEQIQGSSEPAFAELRFQQARCPSGEISPGPSLEVAGVGEVLELAPPAGSELGPRVGSQALFPERARPLVARSRSRCQATAGFRGPPAGHAPGAPASGSHPVKYKPTRPSTDLAKPPQAALPTCTTSRAPSLLPSSCPGVGAGGPLCRRGRAFRAFSGPGRLRGGWRPARVLRSEQLSALLARKRPARAD